MATPRYILTMILWLGAIGFAIAGKYFAVIPAIVGFAIGGWPALKWAFGLERNR